MTQTLILTMQFRLLQSLHWEGKLLQQCMINDIGQEFWVDVPLVDLETELCHNGEWDPSRLFTTEELNKIKMRRKCR